MDWIFPMMYFDGVHFYPFAADWTEHAAGRTVAPGLGIYFLSPDEQDWPLTDITRELHFVRNIGLGGQAYFRYAHLRDNHKGLFDFLKNAYYLFPALPAACAAPDSIPPAAPQGLHEANEGARYVLRWTPPAGTHAGAGLRYNVYASPTLPVDISSGRNLIAASLDSCSLPINGVFCALHSVCFAVTAMDRYGRESAPAQLATGIFRNAETPQGFLPHDSATLPLPAQDDAPYVAVVDLFGRIVRTAPYSRRINIATLPQGIYQVRTLGKKGRSVPIGFFIR